MRACIVSVSPPIHMVSMGMYEEYFISNNIPYDLIFIDPYGDNYKTAADRMYSLKVNKSENAFSKLTKYIKFISFAKQVLKKNDYDLIVLRNEIVAVLLCNFLSKYFASRYVVSVKDLFDETLKIKNEKVLTKMLNKAIESAAITTVSSPGYKQYITDKVGALLVHNINPYIHPSPRPDEMINKGEKPIKILYIGHISYPEIACQMIDLFKNDNRYILQIFGAGSEPVREYALKNGCNNIETRGRFDSGETVDLISQADVIFNVYGNSRHCEQTAYSNKLYYAAYANMPILVSPGTYMATATQSLGLGYAVDFDEASDVCDDFYKWYRSLDYDMIRKKCSLFIADAEESNRKLNDELNKIFVNNHNNSRV